MECGWGWSFCIACYIEYVWNVYEVGMASALILHELCQEIVGEAIGTLKETKRKPEDSYRKTMEKPQANLR